MTEEVTSRKCGTTTRLTVKVFHYLSSHAQASIQSAALLQSSDLNSLLDTLRPARVDRTTASLYTFGSGVSLTT